MAETPLKKVGTILGLWLVTIFVFALFGFSVWCVIELIESGFQNP